jgi:DNA-binding winged helix-turn-helix (wHTH) protein
MDQRRLAVLIGNTTFKYKEDFPMLNNSVNDVQEMATVLTGYAEFDQAEGFVNEPHDKIIQALDDLFKTAKRGDIALVYYSGHGYLDDSGDFFLVSHDSNPQLIHSTSIPAYAIHHMMRGSQCKHKVTILDCCFSGAFIKNNSYRKGPTVPLSLPRLRGEAEVILTSSGKVQLSFEVEKGPNSLFTQYIIDGIKTGKADLDQDGLIAIDELFDYAERAVRRDRSEQTPMKESRVRDSRIIIAVNPNRSMKSGVIDPARPAKTIELNFPNPVSDPKDFFGRQRELKQIEETLVQKNSVVVLGERRIGKTSLQMVATEMLRRRENNRVVCLPPLPPSGAILSWQDFLIEVFQSLCSYFRMPPQDTGLFDTQGQLVAISFGQITEAIIDLIRHNHETFVLIIDEFDVIIDNLQKRDESEVNKLLALISQLVERADIPIVVFLTMTQLPQQLLDSYASPFTFQTQLIKLRPFSEQDASDLIEGTLGTQITLDNGAFSCLCDLTGNVPYLILHMLEHLVRQFWSVGQVLTITQENIDVVAETAASDARINAVFENLYWAHFTADQRQLLLLLTKVKKIDVAVLEIIGSNFLSAARRLAKRSYLRHDDHGHYAFSMDLFRWWFCYWDHLETEIKAHQIDRLVQQVTSDIHMLDETTCQIRVNGKMVRLYPQDYRILSVLHAHAGELVTRDKIVDAVWPESEGGVDNTTIDTPIHRLRKSLENKQYIKTVSGKGFILSLNLPAQKEE